jgi:acyl carrier protein
MSLSHSLLKYIQQSLLTDHSGPPLEEDDSLIELGVLDSIGLLQIMTFLEQEVGVRVPDHEVLPENFETVRQIEDLVKRLRERRA